MVTSVDAERKIDYLINATRALLLDKIDVEMMFRIYKAINDSVLEDLEYLAENADKTGPFRANLKIMSLLHNGLTISAGLDLKSSIEEQEYYISSFGFAVDRYSLSLNNDDRQEWYENK